MMSIKAMKVVKTALALGALVLGVGEIACNAAVQDMECKIAVDEYMRQLNIQPEVPGEVVDTEYAEVTSDEDTEETEE